MKRNWLAILKWLKRRPRILLSGLFLSAIFLYQRSLSYVFQALGYRCRFSPSCSEYARDAILLYGPAWGGWLAVRRLARCHPWNTGGFEPVEIGQMGYKEATRAIRGRDG